MRSTAHLAHMHDFRRRHLHTATKSYQCNCRSAHTMKHPRVLRTHYNIALGAKHDYHKLLATHLHDGIHIAPPRSRLHKHVSVASQAFRAAKLDTPSLYTDNATRAVLIGRHKAHVRQSQDRTHTHTHTHAHTHTHTSALRTTFVLPRCGVVLPSATRTTHVHDHAHTLQH